MEILSLSSNDLTEISLEALADALTGGCLLGAQAVQLMGGGKWGVDLTRRCLKLNENNIGAAGEQSFCCWSKSSQKTRAQSNNLEHHLVVTFESWKEAGVFPSSLSSSFPHVSSKNEVFIGSTFHQIRIVGQVLMLWRDYFPAWNTWSFAIAQSRISPLELANHKMVICFGEKSLDFVGSCISPRRMKAFSS